MTSSSSRIELAIVEAKLFASTEMAVIHAIDASQDADDATRRLGQLGMDETQARTVLDMPLRVRLQSERSSLFAEAERLRDLIN